jgi:predicted DNA-binding antitoxin AbrB/MazE fold protein
MQETVKAVYENGILRPLQPLDWLQDKSQVVVTVVADEPLHPLANCVGILPDEDAKEMSASIADAFEQVQLHEWE